MSSQAWTTLTDWICGIGMLFALASGWLHVRAAGRAASGTAAAWTVPSRLGIAALWAATGTMAAGMWQRYVEVNHFPSQTMAEVLAMFTLALLASMVMLHYALGCYRRGAGWAVLDDVLVFLVFGCVILVHVYIGMLSTAKRDLPPALQTYWFAPHLSSLMVGYATLAIAGVLCVKYFVFRFWSRVFSGGRLTRLQIGMLLALVLVPYLQVVGIAALLVGGVVFAGLKAAGRLPEPAVVASWEKDLDSISFSAFAVGMPFLTMGLWMGSFWAQASWANYWGWDSKENSALITWLVYVIYIHLRMLGGYRGEKAMSVLVGGGFAIFITFQLFGYLPDSQRSLHRYTDDNVVPREGMQGPAPEAGADSSARAEVPEEAVAHGGGDQ